MGSVRSFRIVMFFKYQYMHLQNDGTQLFFLLLLLFLMSTKDKSSVNITNCISITCRIIVGYYFVIFGVLEPKKSKYTISF